MIKINFESCTYLVFSCIVLRVSFFIAENGETSMKPISYETNTVRRPR